MKGYQLVRILICGDRNWKNFEFIKASLIIIQAIKGELIEAVIEGEAWGADKMGKRAAELLDIPVLPFPADWKKHGKAAGPIRNQQMLNEGKPDLVLAFHNDIANSKGTADMVERARKAGIETRIIKEQMREHQP